MGVCGIGWPYACGIGGPYTCGIGGPYACGIGGPYICGIGGPYICGIGGPYICGIGPPYHSSPTGGMTPCGNVGWPGAPAGGASPPAEWPPPPFLPLRSSWPARPFPFLVQT